MSTQEPSQPDEVVLTDDEVAEVNADPTRAAEIAQRYATTEDKVREAAKRKK